MITYFLSLCFIFLPLITFKASYDSFEYPKVIVFVILINSIIAIKFWPLIHNFKNEFRLNIIDKLLLLLLISLFISWGINGFPAVSFWGQYYRYEGLITIISYFIFYFLLSRFAKMEIIHWFILSGGVFYSFYILISGILFNFFHLPVYTFNGRAAGTFGNPNFAAGFLSLSFPYLIYHPKINPIIKVIITPVFLSALLFTQSRSGLIAFLSVIFLFLIKKYKHGLALSLPVFLISLALIFKFIPRYSFFNNQLVVWQKALVAIKQKPIFGWGTERFDIAFQKSLNPDKDFNLYNIRVDKAHNEILEYGATGGIISMIIYISLIITCLINLLKQKQKLWYWTNLSAFIAYLVLSNLNVINITEYIFFYFIIAVASSSQS